MAFLAQPRAAEIRAELARVVASEPFRNTPQLVAFLKFVVEKVLAGEAQEIKGYTIATEALGRGSDFDPQVDPIVRVEAGRLRKALDSYYSGPGRYDPIRIVIPRGTYVPQFEDGPVSSGGTWYEGPPPEGMRAADTRFPTAAAPCPPVQTAKVRWVLLGALVFALAGVGMLAWLWHNALEPIESPWSDALASANGRLVLVVAAAEVVGSPPPGFRPDLLRSSVLDGLARFRELVVIDSTDLPAGGPDRYVLNLRIDQSAGAATVTARLTHDPSGWVLWARSFEHIAAAKPGYAADLDIARQIAVAVAQPYGVLFAHIRHRAKTDEQTRCMQQAYEFWRDPLPDEHVRVRQCLREALVGRPYSASALATLAHLHVDHLRSGLGPQPELSGRALRLARQALEDGPENARANQAMMAVLFARGEVDEALRFGRRALDLNPLDVDIMADLGARYVQVGRYQEGSDLLSQAAALHPVHPPWYHFFLFLAAYMQNKTEQARGAATQIAADGYALGLIARAVVAADDRDQTRAQDLVAKLVKLDPEFASDPRNALASRRLPPEAVDRLLHGLQRAGLRS